MRFHVMTLFPEMIENGLNTSILGKAAEKGVISFRAINMRDYTLDKHGKVDDYPYGGGAGMLIQAQPVFDAYKDVTKEMKKKPRTIYLTPQGQTFNQKMAKELAGEQELVFLCGHYEGIDERVLEEIVTDYVSIGDYVLTGGELPVMVMIDAISRLVPGVLNNDVSAETETFHNDLLEYPQYTRPEVWHDKRVPEVLLSGNHKNITAWRMEQSVERTKNRRPDLYIKYQEKQDVIKRLLKKKRTYIHMIEFLERGMGELFYAKGLNVCIGNSNVTLLSAESRDEAERLFAAQKEHLSRLIITPQEFIKDMLLEQCNIRNVKAYVQACYTNKVPLHVPYKDIHIAENGLIAAYDGEKIIGCMKISLDGSMAKPEIYVEDKKDVLINSLLAYTINKHVFELRTPFIHVEQGDKEILQRIDELGLYVAESNIWKLKK